MHTIALAFAILAFFADVAITPLGGSRTEDPEQRRTQRFYAKNTAGSARSYDLQVGCGSQLQQCSLSIWSINNLAAGDSVAVDATFITPPSGATSTIALLAKVNGTGSYQDSGYVAVTSRVGPQIVVHPGPSSVTQPPGSTQVKRFWIVSLVALPHNFDLDRRCQAPVTACDLSNWSAFQLPPYDSIATDLSYTVPALGATGKAVMVAKYNGTQTVADSGMVTVTGGQSIYCSSAPLASLSPHGVFLVAREAPKPQCAHRTGKADAIPLRDPISPQVSSASNRRLFAR